MNYPLVIKVLGYTLWVEAGCMVLPLLSLALLAGLIPAILFNLYLACNTLGWVPEALRMPIHAYWTGILVNAGLALVAYLASFRFPCRRNLTGLTVWTQQEK